MQITYFLDWFWPRALCGHIQVMFLFVHVIVTYEQIVFVQWGIPIAVRDFLKFIIV